MPQYRVTKVGFWDGSLRKVDDVIHCESLIENDPLWLELIEEAPIELTSGQKAAATRKANAEAKRIDDDKVEIEAVIHPEAERVRL